MLQGMKTALRRTGSTGGSLAPGTIETSDPDLVAYWNFDEGQGYLVKDVTGHGHDLTLTHDPQWQVSRCHIGVLAVLCWPVYGSHMHLLWLSMMSYPMCAGNIWACLLACTTWRRLPGSCQMGKAAFWLG